MRFAAEARNWASAVSQDMVRIMSNAEQMGAESKVSREEIQKALGEKMAGLYDELDELLYQNLFSMLGGDAESDASREHARELLASSSAPISDERV